MNNREIKFRAWDNKERKWLLGYDFPNLGGFSLFGETVLLGEWAHVLDTFLFSRNGYTPDDLKVMQFTGLKDKNGKEIYEGDIVQYQSDTDAENDFPLVRDVVEFRLGAFHVNGHSFLTLTDLTNEAEVIGNIHEHGDLLRN